MLRLLPWVILAAAFCLSVLPLFAPSVKESSAPAAFSAQNALEHIQRIAVEPRPMGSEGNRRGREKIAHELQALGLEPEIQSFTAPNYFSRAGEPVELANILARIPGTDPVMTVAVMGHHDTHPATHGANDNTQAVAILLETARALLSGPALRNDVLLIFTDAEEPAPRYGATTFVHEHPWFDEIGFVINLEAIGSQGASLVVGRNGPGAWLIEQYSQAVPFPSVFSFVTTISELMGGSNTDFSLFRDAGVAGLEFAYMTGSPIYHTMADSVDRVGIRSLAQQGANTLALVRHLGGSDTVPPREGAESVFFTLGRGAVVRYPESWSLPVAVLAGLLLLASMWRHRRGLLTLKSLGATLASTLVSMLLAWGIWSPLGSWRSSMGIAESYAYLAGFALLVFIIGWGMTRLTKRVLGGWADALGICGLWWLIALPLAIAAPGISYLFVWPTLVAALLLVLVRKVSSPLWKLIRWFVVSLSSLVLAVPAIEFFYQFAQPRPGNPDSQILATIIVPVLLLSLTVELLRSFWPRARVV